MKKSLCCLLALCLLLSGFLPIIRTNAQSYVTAEEAVTDANKFLEDKLQLVDYYKLEVNGRKLNKEYAQKGTAAFLNRPIFVYGDQSAASKEASSSGINL